MWLYIYLGVNNTETVLLLNGCEWSRGPLVFFVFEGAHVTFHVFVCRHTCMFLCVFFPLDNCHLSIFSRLCCLSNHLSLLHHPPSSLWTWMNLISPQVSVSSNPVQNYPSAPHSHKRCIFSRPCFFFFFPAGMMTFEWFPSCKGPHCTAATDADNQNSSSLYLLLLFRHINKIITFMQHD